MVIFRWLSVIPHCLMWCICREGNRESFKDTKSSMPDLKLFFFRTLLDCLSVKRNNSLFSIVDLLDLCNFCNWLFALVYFLYTWVTFFFSFWIFMILLLIKKRDRMLWNYEKERKQKINIVTLWIFFYFPWLLWGTKWNFNMFAPSLSLPSPRFFNAFAINFTLLCNTQILYNW